MISVLLWIITVLVFLIALGFLRWGAGKIVTKLVKKLTSHEPTLITLSLLIGVCMVGVICIAVANVVWAFL